MASAQLARPYRDFWTPVLHNGFLKASGYALCASCLLALWQGEWSWSIFQIGSLLIRTLLLYLSALVIYVLRVANWHVGERHTMTPFETFWKYALTKETAATFAAYLLSAWMFGEFYMWAQPVSSRLGYTDPGRLHERIRLNERPIYLRFLFATLACVQATVHLWYDNDRIMVEAEKPKPGTRTPVEGSREEQPSVPSSFSKISPKLVPITMHAGIQMMVAFVLGSFVYFFGMRTLIWEWSWSFAKNMHLISLSRMTKPTGLPPVMELILMFAAEGTALTILWGLVNETFTVYISKPPLKKDKPITSDSPDPNGSLLTGLKSKKQAVKNVALWELAIITATYADRRKTIFSELERKKGPTHKQIVSICLSELQAIVQRINALDPSYIPTTPSGKPQAPAPITLVSQIAQPPKEAPITAPFAPPTSRLQTIEFATSRLARTHSSPQNSEQSKARELLRKGRQEFSRNATTVESKWSHYKSQLAGTPIGYPWRNCIQRTARLVVTGAPYSRFAAIGNAITILTNLTVLSLKEDICGQFQDEVPAIIRQFVTCITAIEGFVEGLEVHWTDMDCLARSENERRKVKEVEEVLGRLRMGLGGMVGAFNEYLGGMGLSGREIVEAKRVAGRGEVKGIEEGNGKGPEMQET